MYVPVYNPTVIYGPWWAPAYLPWYWYPPPIWGYPPRPPGWGYAPGFYWGTAWAVNRNYWGWARPNWHGNNININVSNNYWGSRPGYRDRYPDGTGNWSHAPEHRKGVAYRDAATYNKYRPTNSTGVDRRENYRGNPGAQPYRPGTPAGNPPATQPNNPGLGQPGAFPTNPSTGQPGTRPTNPSVGQPATRPTSPGLGQPGTLPTNPSAGQPGTRPTNPSWDSPQHARPVRVGDSREHSDESLRGTAERVDQSVIGQPATRPTTPGADRPTSRPMPSQPSSRPQQTFQTQSRPQVQAESNRGQASRQNMNQQQGPGNAGGGGGGACGHPREVAMKAPVRPSSEPTMTRADVRSGARHDPLVSGVRQRLRKRPRPRKARHRHRRRHASSKRQRRAGGASAHRPAYVRVARGRRTRADRALDSDDNRAIFAVLGQGSGRLFRSGDPVEDGRAAPSPPSTRCASGTNCPATPRRRCWWATRTIRSLPRW
jgi:hypothetical protein